MPRIGLKDGVRLSLACMKFFGLTAEQLIHTAPAMRGDTVIVTSCDDGRHSDGSLHYVGRAIDVRTYGARTGGIDILIEAGTEEAIKRRQIPAATAWVDRLKQALGPAFDVVLESDHIHIEYQRGSPIN